MTRIMFSFFLVSQLLMNNAFASQDKICTHDAYEMQDGKRMLVDQDLIIFQIEDSTNVECLLIECSAEDWKKFKEKIHNTIDSGSGSVEKQNDHDQNVGPEGLVGPNKTEENPLLE